ncbi:hypothetical protein FQN54_007150 [Arachnomyces sp. PD_36]|nr:hypothetical protein FQN54_007150 [Arachnomyces sp. PD_36]
MPLNTVTVGAAVVPTVVATWFSHYLNRKKLHQKPTAHISYDQSLHLTRKFLDYASHHTVEEIQNFTAPWVPSPGWVKVENITIPEVNTSKAADALVSQLGPSGIEQVGGAKWWQWRGTSKSLRAEWIEMAADYNARKQSGGQCTRVMLYVHGGAYYFGSVDEHRYQIQRHARKLKARVLARALVTIRDQNLPSPAGAILISPWVDLTHSFPSLAGDGSFDYLPPHGFMQKPSISWPPPKTDELYELVQQAEKEASHQKSQQEGQKVPEFSKLRSKVSSQTKNLSLELDGNIVEIKDQIHMYTTNQLLSHPLVSPVLQPSLGGLPPLLIVTGGGEVLRDEQIYLAHKAANPLGYPPNDIHPDKHDPARENIYNHKPTHVQLQVWDDLCHVSTTFSFTRPAKYVYRSIAQFGAWALAHAQNTEIDILDDYDDEESESSPSGLDNPSSTQDFGATGAASSDGSHFSVGKAGDPLPPFRQHMIRQRVDRHGRIYPLGDTSSLAALQLLPSEIGVIKPGPVRKWLAAKKDWDERYSSERRRVQKHRVKELIHGYERFHGDECPPPSALAGRRVIEERTKRKKTKSYGLLLWSRWGSKDDKEKTEEREEQLDREGDEKTAEVADHGRIPAITVDTTSSPDRPVSGGGSSHGRKSRSRSGSRRLVVADIGQADTSADDLKEIAP